MAHARQRLTPPDPLSSASPAAAPTERNTSEHRSAPGGPVGAMHADLARRLSPLHVPRVAPGERLVRFVSMAGGYAALAAGYVGVAIVLLR